MRGSGSKDPRVPSRISYSVFRYVGPINAVYQQLRCRCCSTSTRLEKHATQNATGAITGRTKCGAVCFYLCIPAGTAALVLASLRNGTLSANPNPRNATFERRTLQEKVVVSVLSRAGRSAAVLSAARKRPWRGVNQSWWIVNATNETRVDTVFQ